MRRTVRAIALLAVLPLVMPAAAAQAPALVTEPAGGVVGLLDIELSPTLSPLAPEPGLCAIDDDGSGDWTPGELLYIDVDSDTCATDSEANDVRLVAGGGKPAGSRIRPGDPDLGVPPLTGADQPNDDLKFFDADGDGVFTPDDTLYIDIRSPGASKVHVGDLRLTAYGSALPGTVVLASSPDINLGLTDLGLDIADTGALSYFDVDGDGAFSVDDALYLDQDALAVYTLLAFPNDVPVTQDVRLTPLGPYPFGSVVGPVDLDTVAPLRVAGMTGAITGNLCFIDDDGSSAYEAGEPLYFHVHAACAGASVEPTDLRLVAAAGKPGGTIVMRGDSDDDAPLTDGLPDGIKYYDANADGALNPGDTVYLDLVDDGADHVNVGDLRLTPDGAAPAFAVVHAGEPDVNLGLADPGVATSDANVLAFLDTYNNERFDAPDIAYLNTDAGGIVPTVGTELVEVGDVRLWSPIPLLERGHVTGPADPDVSPRLQTDDLDPEACFIDDDGSGSYNPGEAIIVDVDGDACAGNVEPGDLRLAPSAGKLPGSRVRGSDGDVGSPLTGGLGQALMFYDADGDGAFTLGDTLYLDTDGGDEASVGDLRLTALGSSPAFSTVAAGNDDVNDGLADFPASQGGAHAVTTAGNLAYYDVDADGTLSAPDVLYVVRLGNGDDAPLISIGDVRLMPLTGLALGPLPPTPPGPEVPETPAPPPPGDIARQLQELLEQNAALSGQLNTSLTQNAALQGQLANIQGQLSNQTQQVGLLNSQLQGLQAENQKLSQDLAKAKPASTPGFAALLALAGLGAAAVALGRRK
jgi:PGF-CTERM protein